MPHHKGHKELSEGGLAGAWRHTDRQNIKLIIKKFLHLLDEPLKLPASRQIVLFFGISVFHDIEHIRIEIKVLLRQ